MDQNNEITVLIVDDCPTNRQILEGLLKRDSFSIAQATNGAEAIEVARSVLPHVIIMDVMMPVMDGLEATQILREDPITNQIPIIIVSAKAQEEDLLAGLGAGADEYIFKPIRHRELQLRVRSMVRLRDAQLRVEQANYSLQRQTQILTSLNSFSETLLAGNSIENTYKKIVETAAELLQSDRVSLLIPDISKQTLRMVYATGIENFDWQGQDIPLTSPIAGTVFRTGKEIVANKNEPFPPTIGQYDSPCFLSVPLMCTPLRATGGPIGVLNITEKRDGRDYRPEDIEAIRQMSQTAALALNDLQTRRKLDETRDSIIFSLAKLSEFRHQETGKHLERVQALATLLARQLANDPLVSETIDEQFITDIHRSAPLHDIGKVAIPDRILLKKGKLTAEEFEIMKSHSQIGAETLESIITSGHDIKFLQMAMDIARHHHERYNGKGYPNGLAGQDIPLSARIVCLADCYDAIRAERAYKPARTHEEAVQEILRVAGAQFDPQIVNAFLAIDEKLRNIYDEQMEEGAEVVTPENELVLAEVAG